MAKYRKKPVVIEAVQLRWSTWNEMCDFLGPEYFAKGYKGEESDRYADTCGEEGPYIQLLIPTLEGNMLARHGDWIIKGVSGEFYPCKPDIFEQTYEPVDA